MRAIYIEKPGGLDVLKIRAVDAPTPDRGEVAIAVKASGVNFADILARQGIYPDAPAYPCVVGYEVAGTIAAVGDAVDPRWVGKDVMALTDPATARAASRT
jgi:NADPH:quinone reductase-like Zn-dependent oxidoreductase